MLRSNQRTLSEYDSDPGIAKVAVYEGERCSLPVNKGSVQVSGKEYHVSFNLPEGSVLQATLVKSRDSSYQDSVFITDITRYGREDLSGVVYRSRYEILDLVCVSFPEEYGFRMFGARCIAPYVYVASHVSAIACNRTQDPRVVGFEVISLSELSESILVLRGETNAEESVDGCGRFPPVPDEGKRVVAYKPLIKSMIRKMSGKWRDVYLKRHQPSQLPYDADDLMQFGLMQVAIALRKYRPDNAAKAKEATFVYQHVWHRFGQIAHKYSKKSKGYGVTHCRDVTDDEGNITSPYDLGTESTRYSYSDNTGGDT